jgi:Spy/CpxP family protein refolding chaperone
MRKLQWMAMALLAAWGLGLTAGLLADGPACAGHGDEATLGLAPDDGGTLLALGGGPDGPGGPGDDQGPGMGPGGPGGPGGGGMPGGGRLLKALDLSQDQKDQLKALRRAKRGKLQAAQNALQDAREDLRELMEKGDASDAQIMAKHAEQQKAQAALEELRFQSILDARAILTPAQRKKAAELMKQGMGRRLGGRRGRGQGQGGSDAGDQGGPGGTAPGQGGPHGADGDAG